MAKNHVLLLKLIILAGCGHATTAPLRRGACSLHRWRGSRLNQGDVTAWEMPHIGNPPLRKGVMRNLV